MCVLRARVCERYIARWRRRSQGKYIYIIFLCFGYNAAHILPTNRCCRRRRRRRRRYLFLFLFIHFGFWFRSFVVALFIAKNNAIIRFNLISLFRFSLSLSPSLV